MEYKADRRRRSLAARQNEQRDVATARSDAAFDRMDIHAAQNFFDKRGLSLATISALAAHSVQLPEELLLMTEEEIRQIPDLGSTGLDEVQAYRARFSVLS